MPVKTKKETKKNGPLFIGELQPPVRVSWDKISDSSRKLFESKKSVKIDLGCGNNKEWDWVGVDFHEAPGVDIVQDLSQFPWREIPDNIADAARTSHLLEHINPGSNDPQLAGLIDLLLDKKLVTKPEVDKFVGEYRFISAFVRFMDETWRIMKPGGKIHHEFPMAGSPGYWQDPGHVNGINETTMYYFDPLSRDPYGGPIGLYAFYRPLPWKIEGFTYQHNGFMDVILSKRLVDKSYKVPKTHHISDKPSLES